MKWKNLTIGKKITFGFTLIIMSIICLISYTGVGGIVKNASQVIDGNKLDGNLAQKEVDHLNWANKVNALLTDETITQLDVQIDDHKCSFGKFIYGDTGKKTAASNPELARLIEELKEPHAKLHGTAVTIQKTWKQEHPDLVSTL